MRIDFEKTRSIKKVNNENVATIVCDECGHIIPDGVKYKHMAIHYENGEDKFLYYCPACIYLRDHFLGINYPMYKGVINQILNNMREDHVIERETQRQEQKKKQKNASEWVDDWDHQEFNKQKKKKVKNNKIDEKKFIHYYPIKTTKELAEMLGVYYTSIYRKRDKLIERGLIKKKVNIYDEDFINYYPNKTIKELAKIFGVSDQTIYNKRDELIKKGLIKKKEITLKKISWTKENNEKLLEMYDKNSIEEICKFFNVKKNSIYQQIYKLRKKGISLKYRHKRNKIKNTTDKSNPNSCERKINCKLSEKDIDFMINDWDCFTEKEWASYFNTTEDCIKHIVEEVRKENPNACPEKEDKDDKKDGFNIHGNFNINIKTD